MIHSYPNEYFNLYQLANSTPFTFRQWNNEVNKQANMILDENTRNKFKGDMLEVFSEIFFTLFQNDEAIGIRDYTPIDINEDFGVDATGINANGHHSVIQVKFKSNPLELVPYADIARTFTSAICQLHIPVYAHDNTVFLFTNSNGVTIAFNKVMGQTAIVINRATIATKVDNNANFWLSAYNLIFNTLDS